MNKLPLAVTLASITLLIACETRKSSNPLSPTVAGPVPGVNITTPKLLEPAGGARIAVDKQPVTLVVENAATNWVRPLYYNFEIATDASFTQTVFSREKVAAGEAGKTSLRLSDSLATGRTYYWRALAADGANTGTFTPASKFDIYTPIVIEAPELMLPAVNTTVTDLRPKLTITNAPRSGPVGAITYTVEIGPSDAFINRTLVWTAAEQPSQTVFQAPIGLAYSMKYFWRVRASDPTTAGPWSKVAAFATPTDPILLPPAAGGGGGGGGGGGASGRDAFNLSAAVIHSSPNAAAWPMTATITSLSFRTDGVAVEFTKKSGPGRWPDVVPPGWSGPLQYTLWIAMNIGGTWHTCSPIEYWYGLVANGGDVTINNQIAVNWTYYCGPMKRQPQPGEPVGFFVTAGDQRLKDAAIVHERSNIVVVPFPGSAGATFTF